MVVVLALLFGAREKLCSEPLVQDRAPSQTRGRYFTVRDSIEMARFARGEDEPLFSPDKKHFAVVTTRGVIKSDEIESTLWIFHSQDVAEVLRSGDDSKQCTPTNAARVRAVPRQQYFDSYPPLITELRWSDDSKGILFLAQRADGQRELRHVSLLSLTGRTLTPRGYDVLQFEFAHNRIVYGTHRTETRGEGIPPGSMVITGLPLMKVLFPAALKSQEQVELWTARNGVSHKVIDPKSGEVIRLPWFPLSQSVMAPSPDGQTVIVLVSRQNIPKAWESYIPTFGYLRLHSGTLDRNELVSPSQYAAVDLNSGKINVLFEAPNAWALGAADRNQAVWAADGKTLLLTNTYLPLATSDESEKSKRLRHCAAVVVQGGSETVQCILFANYDGAKRHLLDAAFSKSEHERVILRFWNSPNITTQEEYEYKEGAWKLAKMIAVPSIDTERGERDRRTLSVAIKEDLNTPPALWAQAEGLKSVPKKIWDPNPQLAALELGEAAEFRWKDSTGREWVGGLVRPPGYRPGKRYPLVIQTHGFQPNEFLSDGAYTTSFTARPLAAAGMMVLQVSTIHDHFVTETEASDQVDGYRSAIDHLAADGFIDPEKVGIIGFSRTCYYVETALVTHPQLFAAATIADGVDESYMQYLLFGVGRSHEESEQINGGPPFGDGLKRWVEQAPSFRLGHVLAPLRIEAITPASVLAEWEIYASLWKQQKAVDLIYFPDGQHILQKPLERLASQQGNVDWFRFWLKGEEDPDPAKAEQYKRWRELRKLQRASVKPDASSR